MNQFNEGRENIGTAFSKACLRCGKQILAEVRKVRESILAEARETVRVQEHRLRLAVNEAEALAWQTLYPHLLFPSLATEKIRGATAWENRQRSLTW